MRYVTNSGGTFVIFYVFLFSPFAYFLRTLISTIGTKFYTSDTLTHTQTVVYQFSRTSNSRPPQQSNGSTYSSWTACYWRSESASVTSAVTWSSNIVCSDTQMLVVVNTTISDSFRVYFDVCVRLTWFCSVFVSFAKVGWEVSVSKLSLDVLVFSKQEPTLSWHFSWNYQICRSHEYFR